MTGYKFSRREQALIIVLAVLVIGFISVYYVFMPLLQTRGIIESELNSARVSRAQSASQASAVSGMTLAVSELEAEYSAYMEAMPAFTGTEALEAEFTGFLIMRGLSPESISLTKINLPEEIRDELTAYTISVTATGDADGLLELADYIGGEGRYRLTHMDMRHGDSAAATYVIKAVLRLH